MTEVTWEERVEAYKREPIISKVLAVVQSQVQFKLDTLSIANELPSYMSSALPQIHNDTDIVHLDGALREAQGNRERVAEIQLNLESLNNALAKLFSVAESHLCKKMEIQTIRSIDMRYSIIHDTVRPIFELQKDVKSLLERCELVVKTLKARYDTMWLQHDALKTRLYRDRSMRKPEDVKL